MDHDSDGGDNTSDSVIIMRIITKINSIIGTITMMVNSDIVEKIIGNMTMIANSVIVLKQHHHYHQYSYFIK